MKKNVSTIKQLKEKIEVFGDYKILTDCSDSKEYEQMRQVFNRRFTFRPTAIICVTCTEQVQAIVVMANKYNIHLTVRSGGHDHEGECSATDSWLIDFSMMNEVICSQGGRVLDNDEKIIDDREDLRLSIGPGARFEKIKKHIDQHNLGIPHGTCQTVAIAGFTMGAGWGPWTRKYGMACEHLVAATIVLGDGTVLEVNENDDKDSDKGQLLWALRGGGPLSYGIVTRFVFRPFVLPQHAFSFHINALTYFPNTTTFDILRLWETAIKPGDYPYLIGTNLKVEAKKIHIDEQPDPYAQLGCVMNGYFGGTLTELGEMLHQWHELLDNDHSPKIEEITGDILDQYHGNDLDQLSPQTLGIKVFSHTLPEQEMDLLDKHVAENDFDSGLSFSKWPFHAWDRVNISEDQEMVIKLEPDCPSPHKITSRLAFASWNDNSRKQLICSLQSPLLPSKSEGNNDHHEYDFNTYITLGAISGDFYRDYSDKNILGSAFPYKNALFTIQYQAWWDQPIRDKNNCCDESGGLDQKIRNRALSNRVQDWIECCRDYHIDHTGGAFISFKDASIPTKTYFAHNYEKLVNIKINYSKDDKVLFRTRKTII